MLFPQYHISYLKTIRRTRALSAPGRVLRRVGDAVASDSLVAEADIPAGFRLIELSQELGTRAASVGKVMVKQVGDPVEEGEVIARTGGLFKVSCVSPVKGQILDARGDKVLIEVAPRHVTLTAFYPGRVVNMIPERGVILQVTGALIQGAWGFGGEQRARLEAVTPDGDTPLDASQITAVHMGTILLGGRTLDRKALERAIENQVRGIIVGSISSELLPVLRASALSLMVTEGFGNHPMNEASFALLHSYAGREACLGPAKRTGWKTHRPEVLIPLPAKQVSAEAEASTSLAVGTRVRALRAPHESAHGEVVSLPPHRRRVESGILCWGAEVDLASVGKVFVPFENLEIIS